MVKIKVRLQSLSLLELLVLQLLLHQEDLVVHHDVESTHHGQVRLDGLLALSIC